MPKTTKDSLQTRYGQPLPKLPPDVTNVLPLAETAIHFGVSERTVLSWRYHFEGRIDVYQDPHCNRKRLLFDLDSYQPLEKVPTQFRFVIRVNDPTFNLFSRNPKKFFKLLYEILEGLTPGFTKEAQTKILDWDKMIKKTYPTQELISFNIAEPYASKFQSIFENHSRQLKTAWMRIEFCRHLNLKIVPSYAS